MVPVTVTVAEMHGTNLMTSLTIFFYSSEYNHWEGISCLLLLLFSLQKIHLCNTPQAICCVISLYLGDFLDHLPCQGKILRVAKQPWRMGMCACVAGGREGGRGGGGAGRDVAVYNNNVLSLLFSYLPLQASSLQTPGYSH